MTRADQKASRLCYYIAPASFGEAVQRVRPTVFASVARLVLRCSDARRRIIEIPDGRGAVWVSVQAALATARADYFDALDPEERRELEGLLNKLNDAQL